jgi:hypothetical protein
MINMKVIGKMEKDLVKVFMNIQMATYIMEIGKMILSMAMEYYKWLLEIIIKEIGKLVKRMD